MNKWKSCNFIGIGIRKLFTGEAVMKDHQNRDIGTGQFDEEKITPHEYMRQVERLYTEENLKDRR